MVTLAILELINHNNGIAKSQPGGNASLGRHKTRHMAGDAKIRRNHKVKARLDILGQVRQRQITCRAREKPASEARHFRNVFSVFGWADLERVRHARVRVTPLEYRNFLHLRLQEGRRTRRAHVRL